MLGLSHLGTYEADDNPKPNGRIRALEWPRSLSITSESTGYDEDSMQEHHSVSHVSVSSVDGHSVTYGDDEDCDDYVSSADPASRLEPSDSIPGLPQIPACDVPVPSVGQRKGQPASASSGERVQPHYGSHPRSYFPLVPYRHQPRPPLRDFSSETVTHSAGGRLITWPEGGSSSGQMNLGVYISRVRARLTGCLPNQQALAIDSTPGALIEFIDRVRLRMLPHQGSRLDRILHRADNLEEALAKFLSSIEMSHKFSNLKDFVLLVRACIKYLVQLAAKDTSPVLERVFEAFNEVTWVITAMGKPRSVQSPVIDEQLTRILIILLDMNVTIFQYIHTTGGKVSTSSAFGQDALELSPFIKSLINVHDEFCYELWQAVLCNLPSARGISVDFIRRWLSSQEKSSLVWKTYRSSGQAFGANLPLQWMTELTRKFWAGSDTLLLLTGEAGSGKTALCHFLLDQSRSRFPKGTRVLYFSFETSIPGQRTQLVFLKSLMLQLLEQSNGNSGLLVALCDAYNMIEREHISGPEKHLWSLLAEWSVKTTQLASDSGVLIVVDNLDKVDGGLVMAGKIRQKLHDLVSQRRGFRAIILSRPLCGGEDDNEPLPGTRHHPIDPLGWRDDMRRYIELSLRHSARLDFLTSTEMDQVVRRAIEVKTTSFQMANLLIAFIEMERTYQRIILALRTVPDTRLGFVDHLMMHIDWTHPLVKSLISWLLVAQRNLSMSELEQLMDQTAASAFSGTNAARTLRESCACLVEIRDDTIAFIDPMMKEHILNLGNQSRIPITKSKANQFVLRRCLEYMNSRLPELGNSMPSLDGPDSESSDAPANPACIDPVLDYCISFYIQHYISSSLQSMTGDWKSLYLDSTQLAQWEYSYWKDQCDNETQESWHKRALGFRKAVLGENSRAVIQTLINLAKLSLSDVNPAKALPYLCEAWKIAISVMGTQATICKDVAHKVAEIVACQCDSEYYASLLDKCPGVEELYKYIWKIDQEDHGRMNDGALVHIQLLISMYRHHGKFYDAFCLLQDLYHEAVALFGKFDARTNGYAEQLIDILTIMGRDSEICTLCEDLFEDPEHALNRWDQRRLTILFHMIRCYVRQGQTTRAQGQLSKIWQTLYDLVVSTQTLDVQIALVEVTIERARLFTHQLNKSQRKEAASFVSRIWVALSEAQSSFNDQLLVKLLDLSEYFVEIAVFDPILPILLHLQSSYHDRVTSCPGDAIRVAVALAKCYRHYPRCKDDGCFDPDYLQEILSLLLGLDEMNESYMDLPEEMVHIYISESRWIDAIQVCTAVLGHLWPEILIPVNPFKLTLTLPEAHQPAGIRMALLFAKVKLQQSADDIQTSTLLESIFTLFKRKLPLDQPSLYDAASLWSDSLCNLSRISEAMQMWKELHETCSRQLGPLHEQSIRITRCLISIYRDTGDRIPFGSLDVLLSILRSFGPRPDLCQPIAFEVITVLLSQYERQGKLDEVYKLYDQLWQSIVRHDHSYPNPLSDAEIFGIYEKFSRALLQRSDCDRAIRVTHELQKLLRSNWDASALLCIRADFELAQLLERDAHNYKQVVALYEAICDVDLAMFQNEDQDEILRIIKIATEHLVKIYTTHADLATKAEAMLIHAWKQAAAVRGSSDFHTLECFLRLIRFCRSQNEMLGGNSIPLHMREYVMDLLVEEHDEKRLFERASTIADLYQETRMVSSGIRFMKEVRNEFVSLSPSKPSRLGLARLMLLDRRCLLFVDAVDSILAGNDNGPTLFVDLLQSLMAETALYEAWDRAKRGHYPLKSIFTTSSRLFLFLQRPRRDPERTAVFEDLWSAFQTITGLELPTGGTIYIQLEVCIREMDRRQASPLLVEALVQICIELYNIQSFSGGLAVLEWTAEYFANPTWAKASQVTQMAFRLARSINSLQFGESDRIIVEKARLLVSEILAKLISQVDTGELVLNEVTVQEVNLIIRLLSHGNNRLTALNQIFKTLWDFRSRLTWGAQSTMSLGERLCEVKFALGERKEALDLLQDICYNIRDVYGPLHPLSVECDNLRARLLNTDGQHDHALSIHANVLQEALTQRDSRPSGIIGGQDYLGLILEEQPGLLNATLGLKGGWCDNERDRYAHIIDEVFSMGNSDLMDFHVPSEQARVVGCWVAPEEWTLNEENPTDETGDDLFGSNSDWCVESPLKESGSMNLVLGAQPCGYMSQSFE